MAKFTFRLEPVLEMRVRQERARQLESARLERERLASEAMLRRIQVEFDQARAHLRDALVGRVPDAAAGSSGMAAVRALSAETLHLTRRATAAAIEMSGILRRQEAAREELLRAAAARKAVEVLKAKALERHRRELARWEAADLDELAVMRRPSRGGTWSVPGGRPSA